MFILATNSPFSSKDSSEKARMEDSMQSLLLLLLGSENSSSRVAHSSASAVLIRARFGALQFRAMCPSTSQLKHFPLKGRSALATLV